MFPAWPGRLCSRKEPATIAHHPGLWDTSDPAFGTHVMGTQSDAIVTHNPQVALQREKLSHFLFPRGWGSRSVAERMMASMP